MLPLSCLRRSGLNENQSQMHSAPRCGEKRANGTELSRRRLAPGVMAGKARLPHCTIAGRTRLTASVPCPKMRHKRNATWNAARSAVGCSEWLGGTVSVLRIGVSRVFDRLLDQLLQRRQIDIVEALDIQAGFARGVLAQFLQECVVLLKTAHDV